ncbi:hypothetical protein [Nonlabens sp.]|uniref:hypothetical protein n=1 Tax=Nonlabens sp. TaxID=1888209 RepID=UPI0025D5DC6B|nr:hypothetical protein [Nonlabens sp.]
MDNHGKYWTISDLYILQEFVLADKSIDYIAQQLERSQKACAFAIYRKILKGTDKDNKPKVAEYLANIDKEIFNYEMKQYFINKHRKYVK